MEKLTFTQASGDIRSQARTDFGAFAALYALSPIVFKGTAAADIGTAVASAWGATQPYSDWISDKSALASGRGTDGMRISNIWLDDRSTFLSRKIWYATENLNPDQPNYQAPAGEVGPPSPGVFMANDYFEDKVSGYKIQYGALLTSTRRFVFGSETPEAISGAGNKDHLYGGAGNDTLNGQGDDDYLEGGVGNDTYVFNGQFGMDTILDADNVGSLMFDGAALSLSAIKRNGAANDRRFACAA